MYQKVTNILTLSTIFIIIVIPFVLQGCSSPFKNAEEKPTDTHQHALLWKNRIETEHSDTPIVFPLDGPTQVETSLENRMGEINSLTPANTNTAQTTSIGLNLQNKEHSAASLGFEEAILFAIENNFDIQIAALQPSIAAQSITANEAAFDFVFGAGSTYRRTNTPQQQTTIAGRQVSTSSSSSDNLDNNMSLAKKFYGGGSITLSTDITKTNNTTKEISLSPNPAWKTIGTLDYSQPLLRNFGETVTLSEIRLSKIEHKQSEEELRETLNEVVTRTIQSYLDLSLQWKTLEVKIWLLEQGEHVVEILNLRRSYDTSEADYAQAVATVQKRRADVVSQQSVLHKASDAVKKNINTEEFSLRSEVVIQPTKQVEVTPINISLRQAILTAMENRPDLRKSILLIQSREINMQVADNQRLPQLDMQAQMSFNGLGNSLGDGYEEVFDTEYVNYLAGLSFQIPFGNRAAEANYTSSRLQKMTAVTQYKQAMQNVTIDVKTALRDIITNAELIRANKSFRIAQAENLRALAVEEETMSGLTPTFLNLKLQTQSGLASARIAEFGSVINYNKSIAELYKVMGTTLLEHNINPSPERPTEQ